MLKRIISVLMAVSMLFLVSCTVTNVDENTSKEGQIETLTGTHSENGYEYNISTYGIWNTSKLG